MATGNLMKWREYLQKHRGRKKKLKRAMERLVSQRVRQKKEGGQDKFGGKVSGPVGVSSRVQSLSLAGEGRRGGRGGRERPGSAAVWNMCRLDV